MWGHHKKHMKSSLIFTPIEKIIATVSRNFGTTNIILYLSFEPKAVDYLMYMFSNGNPNIDGDGTNTRAVAG